VVISFQSVGMLVFVPIMVALADRFGTHRLALVNVLLLGVSRTGLWTGTRAAVAW